MGYRGRRSFAISRARNGEGRHMARQRHLLTTHLGAIAHLTGLEVGVVNTEDPALRREPWQPGYWLVFDYVLTGSHYPPASGVGVGALDRAGPRRSPRAPADPHTGDSPR